MSYTSKPTADIPDPTTCRRLLVDHGVPAHICRHSEKVAYVACLLTDSLIAHDRSSPDRALVEAGALLHDICKASSFGTPMTDHAAEGGRLLRRLGFPEVAHLVERHVDLLSWSETGDITEAEIVNYSDKRVLHEKIVSLSERFRDLSERYGRRGSGAMRQIIAYRGRHEALEKKIFRHLPFAPADVK